MGLRNINRQRKKTILHAQEMRKRLYALNPKAMDQPTLISRQSRYETKFDRHYTEMLRLDRERQALIRKKRAKKR